MLYHQIRKFYKACELDNFITKLSDMTNDNLYDVLFDINEVLDAQADCFYADAYEYDIWLNRLKTQIINFREKSHHNYAVVVAIILALALGCTMGRYYTIRQAELLDVTDSEYLINFGDDIHTYTFSN